MVHGSTGPDVSVRGAFQASPSAFRLLPVLTLLLARHGQTDANAERRIQGRGLDLPLNALGRAQAERLAERLAPLPLRHVYTSTLQRTRQTAAPLLARRPDLAATALAGLDEMDWGVHEGQTFTRSEAGPYRRYVARWTAGETDLAVDGGESPRMVSDRVCRAVRRIHGATPDGTVVAFVHGRLLRILLASLLPDLTLARMQEVPHANGGLSVITLAGPPEAPTVARQFVNDTSHLDGLAGAA